MSLLTGPASTSLEKLTTGLIVSTANVPAEGAADMVLPATSLASATEIVAVLSSLLAPRLKVPIQVSVIYEEVATEIGEPVRPVIFMVGATLVFMVLEKTMVTVTVPALAGLGLAVAEVTVGSTESIVNVPLVPVA